MGNKRSVLVLCESINDVKKIKEFINGKKISSRTGGALAFEDLIDRPGFRIASIKVRSAKRVDAIQITYADALGRLYTRPRRGGKGGSARTITLAPDEYVVSISGLARNYKSVRIHRLDIVTNRGRKFSFGQGSGTNFRFSGRKVIGFFGRSGNELDAIGVIAIP